MALDLLIKLPVLALLVEQAAESQNPFAKFSHGNSLLLTKRLNRIELRRAPGGQPASE
jgi:hypothetical protein